MAVIAAVTSTSRHRHQRSSARGWRRRPGRRACRRSARAAGRSAASSLSRSMPGASRERREAKEDADERDALHPARRARAAARAPGQPGCIEGDEPDVGAPRSRPAVGRDRRPDHCRDPSAATVTKTVPPSTSPAVAPWRNAATSWSDTKSTVSSSPCWRIRSFGDRQVVRRRQALLLGAVPRVRLDLEAEQLADERCDSLLVVTEPKPPIEWPRRL